MRLRLCRKEALKESTVWRFWVVVLFAGFLSSVVALAHENHSTETTTGKETAAVKSEQTVSIVSAERNIQTDSGQFNVLLLRSPADPRTSENAQFLVRLTEKIEGGFGGSNFLPLDEATVIVKITKADGSLVADKLPVKHVGEGDYRTSYSFSTAGNYKIVFDVTTEDNRSFSVDFPLTVASAPVRASFWVGLLILSLLTMGTLAAIFYVARKNTTSEKLDYKRLMPLAVAVVLIFILSTVALSFFIPMRETRSVSEISASQITTNALTTETVLTVSKESQLLFGIKTAPVAVRKIRSGLKTTGTVRARPDAKAVVASPVAGRVVLRQGISLGSAVARGETIGFIEQFLDVTGQAQIEQQRLEVETRKLEIRNSILQLQAQQADQRAKANQARTRLMQAQRELKRAENLVEIGAAPRKRLEEAQMSVKIAEQELASAEQQVKLLETQIKQMQAGQKIFDAPQTNKLSKSFPLIAPVTGIVNEVKATSGQQVEAGAELLSIVNLSTVLIEAQIFERDLPFVIKSRRASFKSSVLGDQTYDIGTSDGRLIFVGQTVDPQTRTVPVVYEVINPLNRLRDGMFVEIIIDTSDEREVLAIPKKSVVNEQGQTFVFVFEGGEVFKKRIVVLGAEDADYYEVKSGLKEGERVVVEGIYQLRSTQPTI